MPAQLPAEVPGLDAARRLCRRCVRWLQASLLTPRNPAYEAAQKALATKKAYSLLLDLLSEEQRLEFQSRGFFYVTGGNSGDRYRIRLDSAVNIDVLGTDGTVRHHLCARPTGNIPMYDVMAAQLLYLQDRASEAYFLDQAKRHVTLSFPRTVASRNAERRT